jgi:hypothetical protein
VTEPLWVLPLLHPAAILRGRFPDEPAQVRYLKRAIAIAGGAATPPTTDTLLTGAMLDPAWPADFARWRQGVLTAGVAVDIECAGPHLVCVGLCPLAPEGVPIVVHFRRAAGEPAWPTLEITEAVVGWLNSILAHPDIPKWFHNGQAFDIPYLREVGFEVAGYAGDTLLLARYLAPESPADLQSLGIHWLGMPAWKHLKNAEAEALEK